MDMLCSAVGIAAMEEKWLCMHLVHAAGALIEEISWVVAGQVEMCWWTCGGMTVWHLHCCKVAGLAGCCCGLRT